MWQSWVGGSASTHGNCLLWKNPAGSRVLYGQCWLLASLLLSPWTCAHQSIPVQGIGSWKTCARGRHCHGDGGHGGCCRHWCEPIAWSSSSTPTGPSACQGSRLGLDQSGDIGRSTGPHGHRSLIPGEIQQWTATCRRPKKSRILGKTVSTKQAGEQTALGTAGTGRSIIPPNSDC